MNKEHQKQTLFLNYLLLLEISPNPLLEAIVMDAPQAIICAVSKLRRDLLTGKSSTVNYQTQAVPHPLILVIAFPRPFCWTYTIGLFNQLQPVQEKINNNKN